MKKLSTLLLFITYFSIPNGLTQPSEISVKEISENRTQAPEDRYLALRLDFSNVEKIREGLIKMNDAVAIDQEGDTYGLKNPGFNNDYHSDKYVYFELELPPRHIAELKRVEISLKQLIPTEENASFVRINEVNNELYQNLLDGYHESIRFVPIDSIHLENAKELYSQTEDLSKFYSYLDSLSTTENAKMADRIEFVLFDFSEKVEDVKFLNIDRETQVPDWSSFSSVGDLEFRSFAFDTAPDNWTIELIIENEASVKEYRFEILNIALP